MIKDCINGVQHFGIPTKCMDESLEFYKKLGFEVDYETVYEGNRVAFVMLEGVPGACFEIYEADETAMAWGAIDHIALNVPDINKALEEVKAAGFTINEGPTDLPFYKGVTFFNIEGPNKEKIEFNQCTK